MISILVANNKGGCGKTTIATHLAAAFACAGLPTVLADADRQRSSLRWGAIRPGTAAPIEIRSWVKAVRQPPRSTARLVIDAAAGMQRHRIRELVKMADLLVLPVLPSLFDEVATRRFIERLDELKPIRKNKKRVAVVGNRLRDRTRVANRLDDFLASVGHTVVARLPDRAIYAEVAASGLSIFDLQAKRAKRLQEDWAPLLRYIESVD